MNYRINDCNSCHRHHCYTRWAVYTGLAVLAAALIVHRLAGAELQPPWPAAPPIMGIGQWINSKPLALKDQLGKVVVVHFWTFGCINCRRNLPYYNSWRKDFAEREVQIIGVHTHESAHEADNDQVALQIKELGIKYPVAVDNDRATWKAYENRYWPGIYLIDKQGRVRFRWDGELEFQDAGGNLLVRTKIKELLAEAGPR